MKLTWPKIYFNVGEGLGRVLCDGGQHLLNDFSRIDLSVLFLISIFFSHQTGLSLYLSSGIAISRDAFSVRMRCFLLFISSFLPIERRRLRIKFSAQPNVENSSKWQMRIQRLFLRSSFTVEPRFFLSAMS